MEDADRKFSIVGVTRDSTGTEGGIWDEQDSEDLLLVTDTPPPYPGDFYTPSPPGTPPLSLADQALARLNRSTSSEPTNPRASPPMDTCDLRYSNAFMQFSKKAAPKYLLCLTGHFFLQSQPRGPGSGQRGGQY